MPSHTGLPIPGRPRPPRASGSVPRRSCGEGGRRIREAGQHGRDGPFAARQTPPDAGQALGLGLARWSVRSASTAFSAPAPSRPYRSSRPAQKRASTTPSVSRASSHAFVVGRRFEATKSDTRSRRRRRSPRGSRSRRGRLRAEHRGGGRASGEPRTGAPLLAVLPLDDPGPRPCYVESSIETVLPSRMRRCFSPIVGGEAWRRRRGPSFPLPNRSTGSSGVSSSVLRAATKASMARRGSSSRPKRMAAEWCLNWSNPRIAPLWTKSTLMGFVKTLPKNLHHRQVPPTSSFPLP